MTAVAAVKRQHHGLTLAVLAVAGMSFSLLQTMVAPALPAIQHEYGATTTAVTWVLTIYLLTASIFTPILGRMGDMFGKERLLVIVLLVLGAGTLISALSTSLAVLILGRAVQGAGGAIFPLAFGIIRDEFPREKVGSRHRADLGDVRGRRRSRARAQRHHRRSPGLHLDLLAEPRGDRDRRHRHAPVRARVADQDAGQDRLGRRRADDRRPERRAAGRQPGQLVGLGLRSACSAWSPSARSCF